MIYKVCVVLNRTNEVPNLKKYLDWFKLNTPIEMEWLDTIHTDFDITTKEIGNATFKGVVCGDDIVDKLKTVIPEGKYNAVVLYVGNPLNGIRVSTVNGGNGFPLYPDTELVQLRTISDDGKDLNHELFHAFFMKAHKLQINITDPMDTYIKDSNLVIDNVIDTNREMALQLLKPYWNQIVTFRGQNGVLSQTTWIYFKAGEFTNSSKTHTISELKPELVNLMDKMRGECGFAWKIVSGYRTESENNQLADSKSDSAHTTREAVDVFCDDSSKRQIIIDVARKNGIKRIGIGKTFIHLDISKTLPSGVTWLYN